MILAHSKNGNKNIFRLFPAPIGSDGRKNGRGKNGPGTAAPLLSGNDGTGLAFFRQAAVLIRGDGSRFSSW